jgi:alpha-glucosidase
MQETSWWQRAVIYEVYPRSFKDSNGDGVGDLTGILDRLDYLVDLGIDAIWISPIYPSPMADFGYDVADYCNIDPLFGTLADFDLLLAETHRRGLKMILDFVPNHTSIEHPWFIESRSSRDNPKRDWYLWQDRPNNWLSNFGGSAWEYDSRTSQYYLHSFLREQPDLNWRNYITKLARLGGYLARAHDPPPGNTVIWRGMSRLTDIELGIMIGVQLVGN